jgi:hypothetical protein
MPLAMLLSAMMLAAEPSTVPPADDPVGALLHPAAKPAPQKTVPAKTTPAKTAPAKTTPAKATPKPAGAMPDAATAAKSASAPDAPPPAAAEAKATDDSDIPGGAPTDDYGFVAWCSGALAGHMALYPMVKPQLDAMQRPEEAKDNAKLDQEQLAAGETYLKLYQRALRAAEKASGANLQARKMEAAAQGSRIWGAARAADPQTRMWSWIMWELPARCETAATRLEKSSSLLGAALKGGGDDPSKPENPPEPKPEVKPASSAESGLRPPR